MIKAFPFASLLIFVYYITKVELTALNAKLPRFIAPYPLPAAYCVSGSAMRNCERSEAIFKPTELDCRGL
jgi:hypothetical protein